MKNIVIPDFIILNVLAANLYHVVDFMVRPNYFFNFFRQGELLINNEFDQMRPLLQFKVNTPIFTIDVGKRDWSPI